MKVELADQVVDFKKLHIGAVVYINETIYTDRKSSRIVPVYVVGFGRNAQDELLITVEPRSPTSRVDLHPSRILFEYDGDDS